MCLTLDESILTKFRDIFSRYNEIKKVVIFGSRSRGDNKVNSDIDIAIFTNDGVSGKLYAEIDEIAGIYKVDIVDMYSLHNEKLRHNIEKDGVEIYPARAGLK